MTLDELKREATSLSDEERLQLRFFLKHLERVDSAENRAELSRLDREIDKGNYVTMEQWREMLAALEAKGH